MLVIKKRTKKKKHTWGSRHTHISSPVIVVIVVIDVIDVIVIVIVELG